MSRRYATVQGCVVPIEEARVSVLDRGLLYGDGLFETIRARDGDLIRITQHLGRLSRGMQALEIREPPQASEIESAIRSLLDANRLKNARIRLTVTRGLSAGPGRLTETQGPPLWIVTCDDLPASPPAPARVIVATVRRDEHSPLSALKSLNYLPSVLARLEAERMSANDAILLNNRGRVSDGAVGNVFVVRGDRLFTPSLENGPLPGTVRAAVLTLAPLLGLEVEETTLCPKDVLSGDEVFLTNAIQLVRSVSHIDGAALPHPRGVADRIREALEHASV